MLNSSMTEIRYSIDRDSDAFNNNNIAKERLLIREGLKQRNSPQDIIPWSTREVYFAQKGNSLTPILLKSFKHGQFISDFT